MGKKARKPISATKLKVIVAAGKIPDSELERFKKLLGTWKAHYDALLKEETAALTARQRVAVFSNVHGLLQLSLNNLKRSDYKRARRELWVRHRGRSGVEDINWSIALRVEQARERRLRRFISNEIKAIAVVGDDPPSTRPGNKNAESPASDHLVRFILRYEARRGRLGETAPTSDGSPLVKFVKSIVEHVEQVEEISDSAVRRRIAKHFDGARSFMNPVRRDLTERHAAEAQWRARAVPVYLTVRTVSPRDAREFAAGLAVDLTLDPSECARKDMASWSE